MMIWAKIECCGILKIVGPKKREFWPKINILTGNHCILGLRGPGTTKNGLVN